MKMSNLFAPTLKENPTEAEVISHNLMLRAGMIRQLSSGIYNILPLGLRSLEKIMNIVRRELNREDGQELLLPALQPGELWKETGRWEIYGPELIRFQDRRERDFCLGPTHEEVITDIARKEIRSYRQLPLLLYQIQTKFRDEIRPRFGVMRSREFIMKDLYSFDRDYQGLQVLPPSDSPRNFCFSRKSMIKHDAFGGGRSATRVSGRSENRCSWSTRRDTAISPFLTKERLMWHGDNGLQRRIRYRHDETRSGRTNRMGSRVCRPPGQ